MLIATGRFQRYDVKSELHLYLYMELRIVPSQWYLRHLHLNLHAYKKPTISSTMFHHKLRTVSNQAQGCVCAALQLGGDVEQA